jgi:hypothetical protein
MADWLGSPNYTQGREGHSLSIPSSYVVIHTMVGTIASANSRFQDAGQQASAHYGVGCDGHIVQWVREADTAWHAGVWEVNLDSIGIEHEDMGQYDDPRPDALYDASAALVRDICDRYGIPIQHGQVGVRSGIIAHRETGYATACPDALDVDRIISLAAAGGGPIPIEDTVHPISPVQGHIYQNARWYDWDNLAPLQMTDDTGSTGQDCLWTEAKKVDNVWYDRIAGPGGQPGSWALQDSDIDDGGFDPPHFRP